MSNVLNGTVPSNESINGNLSTIFAKDGVGIASIEQVTISTIDGGSNVIQITLTDGKRYTFEVKNGSKGDKGDTAQITKGSVGSSELANGAVTPDKLDRQYWESPYQVITDYELLDDAISFDIGEDSLLNSANALYTFTFYPATELWEVLGDDQYLGFISEYVGRDGVPKLTLINMRTFERWTYLKGSSQIESVTPCIKDADNAVETRHIKYGAITSDKLSNGAVGLGKIGNGAINNINLFSMDFLNKYLSMPMNSISVSGAIQSDTYDNVTDTGVYNVGSFAGEREMLVVYKLSTAHVVQLRYTTEKIYFRGIHATEDGKFPASEWSEWADITAGGGSGIQDFVYAGSFSAVNELINYAFDTKKVYRVDLSNILGGVVPLGCYLCRKYFDAAVWDSQIVELSPFVADGKRYIIVCETGEVLSTDVIVSSAGDKSIPYIGEFDTMKELQNYKFKNDELYFCYLGLTLNPNSGGIQPFGWAIIHAFNRQIVCKSLFEDTYANVDLSDGSVVDYRDIKARVYKIENTLNGLEDFLAKF